MPMQSQRKQTEPFLSLRWKVVIVVTLILIGVSVLLAALIYAQSTEQSEQRQSNLRRHQERQLSAVLDAQFREMTGLTSLVPLIRSAIDETDPINLLVERTLEKHSAILNLEWGVIATYWIDAQTGAEFSWPDDTQLLPDQLRARFSETPEAEATAVACEPECVQYLSAPVLQHGKFAGTIVLAQSLADALFTFNQLAAADVAIATALHSEIDVLEVLDERPVICGMRIPLITNPKKSLPLLRVALPELMNARDKAQSLTVKLDKSWFEVFRAPPFASGVDAFIINDVTTQHAAIRTALIKSLLTGLLGVLVSVGLLLFMLKTPVSRLRRLASTLPLLAENRYRELRAQLPKSPNGGPWDEIDLTIQTVGNLTHRMERLQRDREKAQERLRWLAHHDPLTHLYNRRRFNEELVRVIDQTSRYQHEGALLFFDLDQFKDVNDVGGHHVGDKLLQDVAQRLTQITRTSDLLARLGGDEFALVLPEATRESAIACAERVQSVVGAAFVHEQERRYQVTASIGIVLFSDRDQSATQLIANADLAMYQAKDRGRGRWHLFAAADESRQQVDARILWREKISDALRNDGFVFHFQPIVEIKTGRVRHFEALLRMHDSIGEISFPGRFIPVAEKTGQIQAIDDFVVRSAVQILNQNKEIKLSVNLSGHAMSDASLQPNLEQLLSDFDVDPVRLTFEITETAAVSSLADATRMMQGIQRLGCRFALDDFGSGFASYAYLRDLPVDDVKIDGTFIRNLADNKEDRVFVKAITDMAHGMGKDVIAEFVETSEILEILSDLGVDLAQGYHVARPAELRNLTQFIPRYTSRVPH